jgi:hypothetical protein
MGQTETLRDCQLRSEAVRYMLSVGRDSKKEVPYNISDAQMGILIPGPSVDHLRVRRQHWRAATRSGQQGLSKDNMWTGRPGGKKR